MASCWWSIYGSRSLRGLPRAGDLVFITGGSAGGNSTPYVFIEEPFTAAGATIHAVAPLTGFDRGAGTADFVPGGLFADSFESGDAVIVR